MTTDYGLTLVPVLVRVAFLVRERRSSFYNTNPNTFLMKRLNIATITLCSTALFLISCPGMVSAAEHLLGRPVKPDPGAVAAANRWFAEYDSGNYRTVRHIMAKRVQGSGVQEEQFVGWARSRRTPLGHVLSRELMWARFTNTIPGTPDGNYEFLRYKTSFQHKAQAEEELTLTKEAGHWEVSGYHFK